jgi:hypothetical protein
VEQAVETGTILLVLAVQAVVETQTLPALTVVPEQRTLVVAVVAVDTTQVTLLEQTVELVS